MRSHHPKRLLVWLTCAFSVAIDLHGSASAAGAPLGATKPWNLDYGEVQCTATREYGGPDGPITLGIVPAPNGASYELIVSYKRKFSRFAEENEGSVIFASHPITGWALKYGFKDLTLNQVRVTSTDMAQAVSAPTVTIRTKDLNVTFALDNMRELLDGSTLR